MNEIEDLRGRQFEWHDSGESSPRIVIVEDPVEMGCLTRVPDLRPIFFGECAGLRLRVDHSVSVLGPTFEVRHADSMALMARSHYTREAELRALFGERAYDMRRVGSLAVWASESVDAVSFRANEVFILTGADPRDAAPLMLLGIVMAIENTLFSVRA